MEGETIHCWMGESGCPSSPLRIISMLALAAMLTEK
jgi:hypothetical protein